MAALVGAVGGLLFLFVFPKGAISTFAHYVLHLPAPGAGIALIVGPLAVVFMIVSSVVARPAGGALLGALAFSVACAGVMAVLRQPVGEKGMVGSVWFVLALGTSGAVAEIALLLTGTVRTLAWRFVLAAGGANLALLIFYWVVIFPRTMGWVPWRTVPTLLAVSLGAGALAGLAGWALAIRLPDFEEPHSRR
jgi:hypothetical protein